MGRWWNKHWDKVVGYSLVFLLIGLVAWGTISRVRSNNADTALMRDCRYAGYATTLSLDDVTYCVKIQDGELRGIPASTVEGMSTLEETR